MPKKITDVRFFQCRAWIHNGIFLFSMDSIDHTIDFCFHMVSIGQLHNNLFEVIRFIQKQKQKKDNFWGWLGVADKGNT